MVNLAVVWLEINVGRFGFKSARCNLGKYNSEKQGEKAEMTWKKDKKHSMTGSRSCLNKLYHTRAMRI